MSLPPHREARYRARSDTSHHGDRQPQEERQPAEEDAQPQVLTEPAPINKSKEKKRVGFASDRSSAFTSSDVGSRAPLSESPTRISGTEDYFTLSPTEVTSPVDDTGGPHRLASHDSLNSEELANALSKILKPEDYGGPIPAPRPVLRKQSLRDCPAEPYSVPLPSELEAKSRADRLAIAIGSSGPLSQRASFSFDYDDDTVPGTPSDTLSFGSDGEAATANDFVPPGDRTGLRPRSIGMANDVMRSLSSTAMDSRSQDAGFTSGTITPLAHDLEYVPRPDSYKGGVLGNLLKLYGQDDKLDEVNYYQSIPSTPTRTPPASGPSTPKREKARHRLWGLSSSTLAGSGDSPPMPTMPGSRDFLDAIAKKEDPDHDFEPVKKLKSSRSSMIKGKGPSEENRITEHIADIITRHQYLVKQCRALMLYGAPTHRLEAYMAMSARVLGIEGQFFYLPGTMIISFDDSKTHTTEVKMLRVPAGVDLGRLRDVHEIYKQLIHDMIGVDEASRRLDEVIEGQDKFSIPTRIILYGVASAFVGPFGFESRYIDMPIIFILGCLVGFLQLVAAPSNELYANVFEITAVILTSFFSRAFGSIRGGTLFCFSTLAQSSICLILPGYMLLCSSLELQSQQMVAGSVRMVYALIYTLSLGYSITIGAAMYGWLDGTAVSRVHCTIGDAWYEKRPNPNTYVFYVLIFVFCTCIINQAKWNQTPVMLLIAVAGYLTNFYSSRIFEGSGVLSNSLGALSVGVLANLYSRLGRHIDNWCLDLWEKSIEPRLWRFRKRGRQQRRFYIYNLEADPEAQSVEKLAIPRTRKIGYGLAATAMLPAVMMIVPSSLAVSGSLLGGIYTADVMTHNRTIVNQTINSGTLTGLISGSTTTATSPSDLSNTAFNMVVIMVQIAISISVGLSLSALLVYPLGKRRSGLFTF